MSFSPFFAWLTIITSTVLFIILVVWMVSFMRDENR